MLGYDYPSGYLDEPKNHRTRSGLCVLGPEGNFLLDCPPELRLQMTREQIQDIDSVMISHTHADHVMGMDDIRSFCIKYRSPMTVFALPEYHADIRRIFPYAFLDPKPGVAVPRFDLVDLPETIQVGGMEITPLIVDHGDQRAAGIRVGDFAYMTDVSNIPDATYAQLTGLRTLVIDAVRYQPHPNHFHFDRSLAEARKIAAAVTYLTHLSHDYDHFQTESTLPDNIRLAYDGLRIEIGLNSAETHSQYPS